VEDLDAADFAETTGSRVLSARAETRRSRARASESDASD
jgi:hypothetical protein